MRQKQFDGSMMIRQGLVLVILLWSTVLSAQAQQEIVRPYNEGVDALVQGRLDDAVRLFTRAIEIDPLDHMAYNNRGVARKRQGLYDKAIEDFTRAIEIKPNYASAWANRGAARHVKGATDSALEDLLKAEKLSRRSSVIKTHLGLLYFDLGELDKAASLLRKAVSRDKKNFRAYEALAQVYEREKDYRKAIAQLATQAQLVLFLGAVLHEIS